MVKLRRILSAAAITLFAVAVALFAVACDSKSYTLKFETNGGTAIESITAAAGETITVPADPVKDGYAFDGWYLKSDFSGDPVQIPQVMPNNNVTYYAKYANVFKLTFETYGGTPVSPITGREGDTIAVPENPKKGGYTFDGWYLNENFSGNPEEIPSRMPATNRTYYAKFTKQLSVSYRLNLWKTDSQGNPVAEVEHTGNVTKTDCRLGDTVTVKENGFGVKGYRFVGWSVNEDGPVSTLEGEKKEGQYAPGDKITITQESNIILYAHWEQKFTNDDYDYVIYVSDTSAKETDSDYYELGSAKYVDKDGRETPGKLKLSPTLDWEFFVTPAGSNKEIVGRVSDSDTDGAKFELRNEDKEGYYAFEDWTVADVKDRIKGAGLYISGYRSMLAGNGVEAYDAALEYDGASFIVTILVSDDHIECSGVNVNVLLGRPQGSQPTMLRQLGMKIDWDTMKGQTVDGVKVQGSYMVQGPENHAEGLEAQENKYIITDGNGNPGHDGYLFNLSIALDGFGNVTVYKINADKTALEVAGAGTYRANGEYFKNSTGEWHVALDDAIDGLPQEFNFVLTALQPGNGNVYMCYLQIERNFFATADGKETLELVSTGNAAYTNEQGITLDGIFTYATDNVVFFLENKDTAAVRYYFKITGDRFEKMQVRGDWLTEGNSLIYYNGTGVGTSTAPLKIPDEITHIAAYAFSGTKIEYLDLNQVTRIGTYAFMGCVNLVSVNFDNKVTEIETGAFSACTALKTIELPAIQKIGAMAFSGANYLEKVTLGANIAELGIGAFIAGDDSVAQSFVIEFAVGTNIPKIVDIAGTASLVSGRSNVSMRVESSAKLLEFWKGEGWENYVTYLRFTYSEEETAALEKYYGAYFTSGFESIQLSEGLTYVKGVPALILFEDGNPAVYLFDETAENNYRVLNNITFNTESDGAVNSIQYVTDDNVTESFRRLEAGKKYAFVSEETNETLEFTLPAEDGQTYFNEGQFILNASYTYLAASADDDAVDGKKPKTESFTLIVVYGGEEKVTIGFVKGSYAFKVESWYWSGNDTEQNTFTAQFQELLTPFYSYDYLMQETNLYDELYFVQKYYDVFAEGQGYLARGVLSTLTDANGKPLVLDDEVIVPMGSDSKGNMFFSIEFVYDGYKKKDGFDEDYEGDGYLYSIQLVAREMDLSDAGAGSKEYVFTYTYMRSQSFSFENVQDGDDVYDITVYTYYDSNMFSAGEEGEPALGELIHAVITLKGEDGKTLTLVDLKRSETADGVYTLIAVNEEQTLQTEYTLKLTVKIEGTGSAQKVTVTGVTILKGATTDYTPPETT